ncbi:MAG: hypothetical protein HGB18_01355 [Candidatus Moranbacteria bacterium]|nr:hypothetical protein [Candidatus Moranbacteria bacterium]
MKSQTVRVIVSILFVVTGGSFLSIAFRSPSWFPFALCAVATSLSLSNGFAKALPVVVALGILADIAIAGRIGVLAFFMVGSAYAAGFFSRRFAVERGIGLYVFAGSVTGLTVAFFRLFSSVFFGMSPAAASIPGGWTTMIASVFGGIVVFPVVSVGLRRLSEWIAYFDPAGTYR